MAEKLLTAKDLTSGVQGISENTMVARFEEFLKSVEADGYVVVPTISAFADYMEKPRGELYKWLRGHPSTATNMKEMCADTIASGAMLKKYVPNVTNFALKNWCGWEEAPQKKSQKGRQTADEKKAKRDLDEYIAAERRKSFKVV